MSKSLVQMSADVVTSQARCALLSLDELVDSLCVIFRTLKEIHRTTSPLDVEKAFFLHPQGSIQFHQVTCLECGNTFKLLSGTHLALHGLTPTMYKHKHGIPLTQALSSRSLSAKRRRLAKEFDIGKSLMKWHATNRQRTEITP